jgi:hypothetical protein
MALAAPELMMPSSPNLPAARGPVSAWLLSQLQRPPHPVTPPPRTKEDPLEGDDFQLALYVCYELHYRGFRGVDSCWEWEPSLLHARRRLEDAFLRRVADEVGPPLPCLDVGGSLVSLATSGDGPSLSCHMLETGTLQQFREFAVHRSAYQLKEADPHTWGIPRLQGALKAAMVAIQADEYGNGVAPRMHASLFGDTMQGLELDPSYGAYLDFIPGTTLATVNLVSLFGLHRRWRGALAGHLALFEMTSVKPMKRYVEALERLGVTLPARRFYEVHVVADVEHEQIALHELAIGLAEIEPEVAGDIVFGARALTHVEAAFSAHLLRCWSAGLSSLRALGRARYTAAHSKLFGDPR